MSNTKKRLNLTLNDELYKTLKNLSDKNNKPISTLSLELIEIALEIEEDRYLSQLGEDRLKSLKAKKSKTLSHDKAWK